jgi:predicted phosphodiesterase
LGFFGNSPATHDDEDIHAFLKNPNATEYQKLLVAAGYLHAAWKDLPAVIERSDNRGQVIAIGDLHADQALIPRIEKLFENYPDATIIFTGNYIDRGKDNIAILFAMVSWQHRFHDRVIFLRGNHETRVTTGENPISNELYRKLHQAEADDVLDALHSTFNELPIAARVGECFACHGGVPECEYDLKNLKKENAAKQNTVENNFFWSNVNLNTDSTGRYISNGSGVGFEIGRDRQIRILGNLKCGGKPVQPSFFVKGHQRDLGGKFYVGKYSDGTPVAMMCTIGSDSQRLLRGFGYWDIDQKAGSATYYGWAGNPKDTVRLVTTDPALQ